MAAKAGQRKGGPPTRRAGRQRLWLVVFALVLVAIFVIFAVAQGIGATSVPSGDAVLIKGVPSDLGSISEADVKRATAQQIGAASSESKGKAPKPGSKKYEELRKAGLEELINDVWIRGEAEEMGISVTDKQVESELATIKKQSFPTPKSYEEFLEQTHFTQEDVNERVEVQIVGNEIKEKIAAEAPTPTKDEIESYYEAEKATQFTTPASRDVRLILNEDKGKIEAAKKALEADQSVKNWKTVAAKYSSDPSTKTNGGLQKAITEEFVTGQLKKAIFDSATGELEGPIKFQKNYLLIEVVKLNPEKAKTLAEVRSQISQTLAQKAQEEFFNEFIGGFSSKWTSRTFCGSEFLTSQCSNFKSSGHPETASPSCYEADPKTPPKECPAPVIQTTPAIPGTVTTTEPKGERLVQRPQPEGLAGGKEGAAETPAGAAETPEAATPEEGASGE